MQTTAVCIFRVEDGVSSFLCNVPKFQPDYVAWHSWPQEISSHWHKKLKYEVMSSRQAQNAKTGKISTFIHQKSSSEWLELNPESNWHLLASNAQLLWPRKKTLSQKIYYALWKAEWEDGRSLVVTVAICTACSRHYIQMIYMMWKYKKQHK